VTPEDLEGRVRELRAAYSANQLSVLTLTLQLYGLYVEVVEHIAAGKASAPQLLCRTLLQAIRKHFPDRPWTGPDAAAG
jgi:hypothetical protein